MVTRSIDPGVPTLQVGWVLPPHTTKSAAFIVHKHPHVSHTQARPDLARFGPAVTPGKDAFCLLLLSLRAP